MGGLLSTPSVEAFASLLGKWKRWRSLDLTRALVLWLVNTMNVNQTGIRGVSISSLVSS